MENKNLILIGSSIFFYSSLAVKYAANFNFFQILIMTLAIGAIEGILGYIITNKH